MIELFSVMRAKPAAPCKVRLVLTLALVFDDAGASEVEGERQGEAEEHDHPSDDEGS